MPKKTLHQHDKAIVAAERDSELQQMEQRLSALKQRTDWDLPQEKNKALRDSALDAWIAAKVHHGDVTTVELGFGFILKKAQMPHGVFESWVKSTGYSMSMVQKSMRVAQMVFGLPEAKAERVPLLPARKQIALAQMPAAIRDAFLDEFTDKQIQQMRLEDMAEWKAMQQRIATLEANEVKFKNQLLTAKRQAQPYPASVMQCRMEVAVLTDQCIGRVQMMYREMLAIFDAPDLSNTANARQSDLRAALAPAYTNLLGVAAELHAVIHWLEQSTPVSLPKRASDLTLLLTDEIETLKINRESMLGALDAEKNTRIKLRHDDGEIKRGKGRPAGTTKKAKTKSKR